VARADDDGDDVHGPGDESAFSDADLDADWDDDVEDLTEPGDPEFWADDTRVDPALRRRRRLGNVLVVLGALTGLLAIAYVVDMLMEVGDVPRGVTVAGVEIGGLDRAEAQDRLRRELEPLVTRPVVVRAGESEASFDPAEAGLGVDWAATVEQAGAQPWLPWERFGSFFGGRELDLVTTVDDRSLRIALGRLAQERLNRPAIEGGIAFRPDGDDGGVRAYAIEPRAGVRLSDLEAAVAEIRAHWPQVERIDVAVETVRPKLTSEAVHTVLDGTIRPLLAGPVVLRGDGGESVLLPEDFRRALVVEVRPLDDGDGNAGDGGESAGGEDDGAGRAILAVTLKPDVLRGAVQGELDDTERPARDAALVFRAGVPEVVPSVPGVRIDWERTFAGLIEAVASAPEDRREVPVLYQPVEPSVRTADVQALGITDVLATARSAGHSPEELAGMGTALGRLNGAVVRSGETVDLSAYGAPPPLEAVLRDALAQAGLHVTEQGTVRNDTGAAVAVHAAATTSTVQVTVWGTPT
jgi:hypothetical protein